MASRALPANWGREATAVWPSSDCRCRTVTSVWSASVRAAAENGPAQNVRSYGRIPLTGANVSTSPSRRTSWPFATHSQPSGMRTANRNVAVRSGWSKQQNSSGAQSG